MHIYFFLLYIYIHIYKYIKIFILTYPSSFWVNFRGLEMSIYIYIYICLNLFICTVSYTESHVNTHKIIHKLIHTQNTDVHATFPQFPKENNRICMFYFMALLQTYILYHELLFGATRL